MSQSIHTGMAAHLAVIDGQVTTTTHDIARVYGKQHADVLRIVRQRMAECPPDWCLRNFAEASVELPQPNGGTVSYPVIRLSKKGFHFVVGKFTGAKAVRHQIAFADEFERMEAELAQRPQALPALDPASPNARLALTGAAQLGAEVQAEALAQLARDEWLESGRWLLSFVRDEYRPDELRPHVKRLEPGTYVTTLRRLADNMSDPASMHKSEDLAHLARACLAKLERRAAYASQLEIAARQAKTQR